MFCWTLQSMQGRRESEDRESTVCGYALQGCPSQTEPICRQGAAVFSHFSILYRSFPFFSPPSLPPSLPPYIQGNLWQSRSWTQAAETKLSENTPNREADGHTRHCRTCSEDPGGERKGERIFEETMTKSCSQTWICTFENLSQH